MKDTLKVIVISLSASLALALIINPTTYAQEKRSLQQRLTAGETREAGTLPADLQRT